MERKKKYNSNGGEEGREGKSTQRLLRIDHINTPDETTASPRVVVARYSGGCSSSRTCVELSGARWMDSARLQLYKNCVGVCLSSLQFQSEKKDQAFVVHALG